VIRDRLTALRARIARLILPARRVDKLPEETRGTAVPVVRGGYVTCPTCGDRVKVPRRGSVTTVHCERCERPIAVSTDPPPP
jgi:uncharacterized paraquat-inducible protein A